MEGTTQEGPYPRFWARKGKMVIEGKGVTKKGVVECRIEYSELEWVIRPVL